MSDGSSLFDKGSSLTDSVDGRSFSARFTASSSSGATWLLLTGVETWLLLPQHGKSSNGLRKNLNICRPSAGGIVPDLAGQLCSSGSPLCLSFHLGHLQLTLARPAVWKASSGTRDQYLTISRNVRRHQRSQGALFTSTPSTHTSLWSRFRLSLKTDARARRSAYLKSNSVTAHWTQLH